LAVYLFEWMASIRPEAGRGYIKRDRVTSEKTGAGGGLLEEFPVLCDEGAPLRGDVEFVEDGIHRTDRDAVSAVDAGGWVDVIHLFIVCSRDAVNGADIHTGGVFNPGTRLCYYEGHTTL